MIAICQRLAHHGHVGIGIAIVETAPGNERRCGTSLQGKMACIARNAVHEHGNADLLAVRTSNRTGLQLSICVGTYQALLGADDSPRALDFLDGTDWDGRVVRDAYTHAALTSSIPASGFYTIV